MKIFKLHRKQYAGLVLFLASLAVALLSALTIGLDNYINPNANGQLQFNRLNEPVVMSDSTLHFFCTHLFNSNLTAAVNSRLLAVGILLTLLVVAVGVEFGRRRAKKKWVRNTVDCGGWLIALASPGVLLYDLWELVVLSPGEPIVLTCIVVVVWAIAFYSIMRYWPTIIQAEIEKHQMDSFQYRYAGVVDAKY